MSTSLTTRQRSRKSMSAERRAGKTDGVDVVQKILKKPIDLRDFGQGEAA